MSEWGSDMFRFYRSVFVSSLWLDVVQPSLKMLRGAWLNAHASWTELAPNHRPLCHYLPQTWWTHYEWKTTWSSSGFKRISGNYTSWVAGALLPMLLFVRNASKTGRFPMYGLWVSMSWKAQWSDHDDSIAEPMSCTLGLQGYDYFGKEPPFDHESIRQTDLIDPMNVSDMTCH